MVQNQNIDRSMCTQTNGFKKIDSILQFNDFVVQPHLVMAVVVVTGWVGGGDGGCGLKVKEVMAVECEFDVAMAIGWCQQCWSGIG